MIDFGIVTLLILQLLIAGACTVVFVRISIALADQRRANGDSKSAEAIAREALAKVVSLDTDQYQALVKRIFAIEGTQEKWNRTLTDYLDEVKTLSMRVAALKRWSGERNKKKSTEPDEEVQEVDEGTQETEQQEVLFPNFGKKINRKAG